MFPQGNTFVVIDGFTAPPVPRLLSAVFANDGASVSVTFDGPTNQGGIPGSRAFACSRILTFDGCATTSCQWSRGSSAIVFYPGPNSLLNVGSRITLLPHTVTAACTAATADGINCSLYQFVNIASANLLPPANAIQPTVSIGVPPTIGTCCLHDYTSSFFLVLEAYLATKSILMTNRDACFFHSLIKPIVHMLPRSILNDSTFSFTHQVLATVWWLIYLAPSVPGAVCGTALYSESPATPLTHQF